jgi:hypothetical protein
MTKKIPNLATLLDELNEAKKVAEKAGFMTYAHGYEDGLQMALDILEGNID